MTSFSNYLTLYLGTNYVPYISKEALDELLAEPQEHLRLLEEEIQVTTRQLEAAKDKMEALIKNHHHLFQKKSIASVSDETLSQIFLFCLPSTSQRAPTLTTEGAPLVLGQVCRRWRQVAYEQTPRLWTSICVSLPPTIARRIPFGDTRVPSTSPRGYRHEFVFTDEARVELQRAVAAQCTLLSNWLTRSASLPLSIFIRTTETNPIVSAHLQPYLDTLLEFSERWETLKVLIPSGPLLDRLCYVLPSQVPRLKNLFLRMTFQRCRGVQSEAWCSTGLLRAPNLRRLSMDLPQKITEIYGMPLRDLTHLLFRQDRMGSRGGLSQSRLTVPEAKGLLLECPNLVDLTMELCDPRPDPTPPPLPPQPDTFQLLSNLPLTILHMVPGYAQWMQAHVTSVPPGATLLSPLPVPTLAPPPPPPLPPTLVPPPVPTSSGSGPTDSTTPSTDSTNTDATAATNTNAEEPEAQSSAMPAGASPPPSPSIPTITITSADPEPDSGPPKPHITNYVNGSGGGGSSSSPSSSPGSSPTFNLPPLSSLSLPVTQFSFPSSLPPFPNPNIDMNLNPGPYPYPTALPSLSTLRIPPSISSRFQLFPSSSNIPAPLSTPTSMAALASIPHIPLAHLRSLEIADVSKESGSKFFATLDVPNLRHLSYYSLDYQSGRRAPFLDMLKPRAWRERGRREGKEKGKGKESVNGSRFPDAPWAKLGSMSSESSTSSDLSELNDANTTTIPTPTPPPLSLPHSNPSTLTPRCILTSLTLDIYTLRLCDMLECMDLTPALTHFTHLNTTSDIFLTPQRPPREDWANGPRDDGVYASDSPSGGGLRQKRKGVFEVGQAWPGVVYYNGANVGIQLPVSVMDAFVGVLTPDVGGVDDEDEDDEDGEGDEDGGGEVKSIEQERRKQDEEAAMDVDNDNSEGEDLIPMDDASDAIGDELVEFDVDVPVDVDDVLQHNLSPAPATAGNNEASRKGKGKERESTNSSCSSPSSPSSSPSKIPTQKPRVPTTTLQTIEPVRWPNLTHLSITHPVHLSEEALYTFLRRRRIAASASSSSQPLSPTPISESEVPIPTHVQPRVQPLISIHADLSHPTTSYASYTTSPDGTVMPSVLHAKLAKMVEETGMELRLRYLPPVYDFSKSFDARRGIRKGGGWGF